MDDINCYIYSEESGRVAVFVNTLPSCATPLSVEEITALAEGLKYVASEAEKKTR